MEFDNHEAIKTMVALGFGIALEPVSAVQRELISGQLVRLERAGAARSSRTTSLILRRGERRSEAVRAFLGLLEQRYSVTIPSR